MVWKSPFRARAHGGQLVICVGHSILTNSAGMILQSSSWALMYSTTDANGFASIPIEAFSIMEVIPDDQKLFPCPR